MTKLEKIRKEKEKAEAELAVAEHQLVRLSNRLNNALKKQSKARTHRLIVEGAELEYVFEGIEEFPQQIFWDFMHKLKTIPGVMKLFEEAKASLQNQPSGGKEGDA